MFTRNCGQATDDRRRTKGDHKSSPWHYTTGKLKILNSHIATQCKIHSSYLPSDWIVTIFPPTDIFWSLCSNFIFCQNVSKSHLLQLQKFNNFDVNNLIQEFATTAKFFLVWMRLLSVTKQSKWSKIVMLLKSERMIKIYINCPLFMSQKTHMTLHMTTKNCI